VAWKLWSKVVLSKVPPCWLPVY
nr:angiotensin I-converting enzyme inhibitory factor - skipjack tuna (fragments) [Katsuwonus pelamis]